MDFVSALLMSVADLVLIGVVIALAIELFKERV